MGLLDSLFGGAKKEGEMKMNSPMHETETKAGMAEDPVCHMTVDPNNAAATSVYEGKTYYFCAVGCKKAFDQDPAKYLSGEEPQGMHGGHGGCCC